MVFERADEVILPAMYNFVAQSFQATPTQLAFITLSRALVQALASPLGGLLGTPHDPGCSDRCCIHTVLVHGAEGVLPYRNRSAFVMCRPLVQQDKCDHLRVHHLGLDDPGVQPVKESGHGHLLLGHQWAGSCFGDPKCTGEID